VPTLLTTATQDHYTIYNGFWKPAYLVVRSAAES